MADTYEKDLAQKSSLTTSDFIRVVGSDNVSYKQNMSSVMETMGLKYADLGSFSTQSDLETALNNKLTAMPTNSTASLRIAISATFGAFQSGVSYIGELRKGGSATYASISLHGLGINAEIVGNKSSATWTFQKEPTRAEVDAIKNNSNLIRFNSISSASTQTVEQLGVGNTTYGTYVLFMRIDSGSDGAWAGFVRHNAAGYQISEIYKGTHAQTPFVDTNGVVKTASTTAINVHAYFLRLASWS